jgi:hypothetical protein
VVVVARNWLLTPLGRAVGSLLKGRIDSENQSAFGKRIPACVVFDSLTLVQRAENESMRERISLWVLIARRQKLVQKEIIPIISRLIWDGRQISTFENVPVPVRPSLYQGGVYVPIHAPIYHGGVYWSH